MYLLYKGDGTMFVHILRGDSHSFNYEYGVDQGGCLSNIKRCWFVRPILLWVNLFSMNFKLSRGDCIIEVWINLILLQDWVQLLFSSDQGSFYKVCKFTVRHIFNDSV